MVSDTLGLREGGRPKRPAYPKSTLASWAIGQDGLHGSIRVLDSLRAVRVRDDLRRGRAVRMLRAGNRSACLDRIGGSIPLGNTSGQLDVVVLSARTIPLRDPTGGQAWRRKGRALGAWSRSARHLVVSLSEQSICFFPRLDCTAKVWVVREVAVRSGEPFAGEGRRWLSGLQEARAPLWKEKGKRSQKEENKDESKEAKRRRKRREREREKRGAARLEKERRGRERRWMASLRLSPRGC